MCCPDVCQVRKTSIMPRRLSRNPSLFPKRSQRRVDCFFLRGRSPKANVAVPMNLFDRSES